MDGRRNVMCIEQNPITQKKPTCTPMKPIVKLVHMHTRRTDLARAIAISNATINYLT